MKLSSNNIILSESEKKKKPKKITGTKLAAVLGLNPYCSPFEVWCNIVGIYEAPFEDTIYTVAGKIIEPMQAEYIRNNYSKDIVYPKDIYGDNYFNKMHGNFFTDKYFGGMWDYLEIKNELTTGVFEMKTAVKSKRSEWVNNVPEYYALQASLYAWLLNVDKVIMVATFLDSKNGDYDHPENVILNTSNTIIKEFYVNEKYPNFEDNYIIPAKEWWDKYVETGISPEWDSIRDNNILVDLDKSRAKQIMSEVNSLNSIKPLDDLMNRIQDDLLGKLDINYSLVKNYYFELTVAVYFMSNKVIDQQSKDKLEAAKIMINTLQHIMELGDKYI